MSGRSGTPGLTVAEQTELFKAETSWFHVFKTMVDSGDVAAMGPHAVAVYLVVKSHTNFATGRAFPALETIAEKSGVSLSQVQRELKTLAKFGYVTIEKLGRKNHYTLREKVEIKDESGRPSAVATWDYLPTSVGAAVAELKHVLMTGDIGGARIVNIERLVVNVAQAGGTVLNIDAGKLNEYGRQQLAELVASIRVGSVDKGR